MTPSAEHCIDLRKLNLSESNDQNYSPEATSSYMKSENYQVAAKGKHQ